MRELGTYSRALRLANAGCPYPYPPPILVPQGCRTCRGRLRSRLCIACYGIPDRGREARTRTWTLRGLVSTSPSQCRRRIGRDGSGGEKTVHPAAATRSAWGPRSTKADSHSKRAASSARARQRPTWPNPPPRSLGKNSNLILLRFYYDKAPLSRETELLLGQSRNIGRLAAQNCAWTNGLYDLDDSQIA